MGFFEYNWLHNSIKYGARFDGNGAGNNGMMHHNVMWGLGNSGIMAKGYEFKIFNNTVIDGPDNKNDILIMIEQGGNEGTLTHNNVTPYLCITLLHIPTNILQQRLLPHPACHQKPTLSNIPPPQTYPH